MMIYPWQLSQWQQLLQAKQMDRLAHALLFTGMPGIGKAKFAEAFALSLLCQQLNQEGFACGECHACRLITGRAHPNVLWIEPEKEGQAIKVDSIREVGEFINQSSLQGKYRVVIISPANRMNISAANALLKTLEEPSSGAVLILISDQNEQLPATILSRCQRILFPKPRQEEAYAWLKQHLTNETIDPALLLKLTHGAPLAALHLADEDVFALREVLFKSFILLSQQQGDPIKLAAKLTDMEILPFLDFALTWLVDLIRLQLEANTNDIMHSDFTDALLDLVAKTQLKTNMQLLNYLQQMRAQVCTGINFNKQLLIESIFIRWGHYVPS